MKTKEQLVSENARLHASSEEWSKKDSIRRSNFAKVFGRTDNRYGLSGSPADLSWEEIFCEVGKLISDQNWRRFKDDIEFRINQLKPSPVSKETITHCEP